MQVRVHPGEITKQAWEINTVYYVTTGVYSLCTGPGGTDYGSEQEYNNISSIQILRAETK